MANIIGDSPTLGPNPPTQPTEKPKVSEQDAKVAAAKEGAIKETETPSLAKIGEAEVYEAGNFEEVSGIFDKTMKKPEEIEGETKITSEEQTKAPANRLEWVQKGEEVLVDVLWVEIEQFAEEKDLPPLISLKELDQPDPRINQNEREFIKRWLLEIKGLAKDKNTEEIAIYAFNKGIDKEHRFLIVPEFEKGDLIGCRIIKSLNKHNKVNAEGKKIKPKGTYKVFSNAHPFTHEQQKYASLGVVEKEENYDVNTREEENLRMVSGHDQFVQTLYAISYVSKKSKIDEINKKRYFQKHAGENLETLDKSKLDKKQKMLITQQLLNTVKYMKECQLVHRDLKTANVFVSMDNGKPKVVLGDLGFMAILGEVNSLNWTPHACSPEVVAAYLQFEKAGQKLNSAHRNDASDKEMQELEGIKMQCLAKVFEAQNHAHDLWGLGTILLTLWTNQELKPWELDQKGEQVEEDEIYENLVKNDYTETIANLLKSNHVPETIQSVILGCLTKDPSRRPAIEDIIKGLKEAAKKASSS